MTRENDRPDANSLDLGSGEDAKSTSDDDKLDAPDVNEQVEAEWVEETTPFDRVRTVMEGTYKAQTVNEIAERARSTPTLVRKQLRYLEDVGFVEKATDPDQDTTVYRRSPESVVFEQARRIISEVDPTTLEERVAEMQDDIRSYQERFEAASPEEAVESSDNQNREEIREWRTTRRNLEFAKVALVIREATQIIRSEKYS